MKKRIVRHEFDSMRPAAHLCGRKGDQYDCCSNIRRKITCKLCIAIRKAKKRAGVK